MMAKLTSDEKMALDSDENYFSELRRLGRNVDRGMKEVQSRIEGMTDADEVGIDQHTDDETKALLFLQRSQKDLKEIGSNVKLILEDFKLRSSTLNSVSSLFQCALENFKTRLENVESFTEKYGYRRLNLTISQTHSSDDIDETISNDEDAEISSISGIIAGNRMQVQGDMVGAESYETEKMVISDPSTPKLEDIGLSEDTMFKLNSGYFDCYERNTFPRNVNEKNKDRSPLQVTELSTPKLEAYGISDHTLRIINEDLKGNTIEKELGISETPKISRDAEFISKNCLHNVNGENTLEKHFDLPPTPKLEGISEHTLLILDNTTVNKENVRLDSTPTAPSLTSHYPSPKLGVCETRDSLDFDVPSTPNLESYGISQHTLRFLNRDHKKQESYFDFDMHATPKLDGISKHTSAFLKKENK